MFSHVMLGSDDIARSKVFYDALLGSMGGPAGEEDYKGRLRYMHNGGILMISKPINGAPATAANGGTVGFRMDSPEDVDAWHTAGCANGGITCEDPPGPRDMFGRVLYLAYLRDPDGNKLCGLHLMPSE
ncbi:MAG: VOC family protein [Pseudomonadota bacterium]